MKIDVKLNRRGARDLVMSRGVQRLMYERALRLAQNTGRPDDYEVSSRIGKNRARASVITATPIAMARERKRKVLLRALGGM